MKRTDRHRKMLVRNIVATAQKLVPPNQIIDEEEEFLKRHITPTPRPRTKQPFLRQLVLLTPQPT